ncbi:MAG: hypothetical protein AAB445_03985 [Patescibacteria group bacterium]
MKPQRAAFWFVVVCSITFGVWLLNNIVAFSGVHIVTISSFLHLPGSAQYVGGADVGVVSTPEGKRTRPYTDQLKFAVTLPRGFDTMTMTAEVETDPYATVTLGAKVLSSDPDQSVAFRNPAAYSAEWRRLQLGQGSLYVKNHPEIQDVDAFWKNFSNLQKVYSIGEGLKGSIPSSFYAPNTESPAVQLPGGYRGSFTVNAFFDGKPQKVTFDTKVVYSDSGKNTLRFTLEHQGVSIVTKNISDGGRTMQRHIIDVPAGDPGFYTLRFSANSEATVVSNVQFQGDAIELGSKLFLEQSSSPVTLYTKCPDLTVVAVHQLGIQNPISVNGKQVRLPGVKQSQDLKLKNEINTLVFPRADVGISNSCGFLLKPEGGLRAAFEKIARRITEVPRLAATTVEAADFLYDPVPVAPIASKKGGTYLLEKTFDLHTLSAKGKTFTFSLSDPGLTTQAGAFLHIKKITFTAKRPPFAFSEIAKLFRALAKQ